MKRFPCGAKDVSPDAYNDAADWAAQMLKTHFQRRCPVCKLFHIWVRRVLKNVSTSIGPNMDGPVIKGQCHWCLRTTSVRLSSKSRVAKLVCLDSSTCYVLHNKRVWGNEYWMGREPPMQSPQYQKNIHGVIDESVGAIVSSSTMRDGRVRKRKTRAE